MAVPVIGGSVDSISIGGRGFAVAADAELQIETGGDTNESQPNGNGSVRLIKTKKLPSIKGLQVEISDDRGDHQFLQNQADLNTYFPVAITLVDGTVYFGDMQIDGDFSRSTQSSLATFDLVGPALSK